MLKRNCAAGRIKRRSGRKMFEIIERPDAVSTKEWMDKVYPQDVFGESFNRKQVEWMIAAHVFELKERFYFVAKTD